MTQDEARAEAIKRWGEGATVTFRPRRNGERRGRLARYSCIVSSGAGGFFPLTEGQGDTWQAAFADALGAEIKERRATDYS